eukprot:5711285-Alexandrium_andersonii.AAC.1
MSASLVGSEMCIRDSPYTSEAGGCWLGVTVGTCRACLTFASTASIGGRRSAAFGEVVGRQPSPVPPAPGL